MKDVVSHEVTSRLFSGELGSRWSCSSRFSHVQHTDRLQLLAGFQYAYSKCWHQKRQERAIDSLSSVEMFIDPIFFVESPQPSTRGFDSSMSLLIF